MIFGCGVPVLLVAYFRPRRSRSVATCSRQTFPWTICRSVCASVGRSVCPVHCGKTADWIRMPFGVIGRTGPGIRQLTGFGDPSTGRGTFGGKFGTHHCNQWGLYGVRMRQRRDAALFPNYFGETCSSSCRPNLCMGLRPMLRLVRPLSGLCLSCESIHDFMHPWT